MHKLFINFFKVISQFRLHQVLKQVIGKYMHSQVDKTKIENKLKIRVVKVLKLRKMKILHLKMHFQGFNISR